MHKNILIILLICLGKITTTACTSATQAELDLEERDYCIAIESFEKQYKSDCERTKEQLPAGDYYYNMSKNASTFTRKYAALYLADLSNHTEAQYELGNIHYRNLRPWGKRDRAWHYYDKAAGQGHGLACYRMGLHKSEGILKMPQDLLYLLSYNNTSITNLELATYYFIKASDKLDLFAVEEESLTPVALLSQIKLEKCLDILSAQNGDTVLSSWNGLFFSSTHIRKDIFKRLQEKATQGEPIQQSHVQYVMGLCYDKRFGVAKDQEKAIECFRIAAAQGNPNAVARLERMGLPLNPLKRKASETEGDTNDAGERLEETKEPSNSLKRKASDVTS
jgi:TPR repeat protein